jgi:integrase
MRYQYVRAPFTADEVGRLAAACEAPTAQFIVWTLLDTGRRVSEMCAPTSQEILWQQHQIRIKAKDGPYGEKTKVRLVPMSPLVRDAARLAVSRQRGVPPPDRRAIELAGGVARPAALLVLRPPAADAPRPAQGPGEPG